MGSGKTVLFYFSDDDNNNDDDENKRTINMFNIHINFSKNLSHKHKEYIYYMFVITSHRIFKNEFEIEEI